MVTLIQDVRYALRMLWKNPAFTTVAVLTLALGIGANTAIFTLINAVLLKALPVKNPEQLVVVGDPAKVHNRSRGTPLTDVFSYPLYREISRNNQVFSGMLASGEVHQVRIQEEHSREITSNATAVMVSGNYFSVLGVNPLLGRLLTEDDDSAAGAHPVAVVSYRFWKDKLATDPGIVDQTIRVNNYPFTVVGVAPPEFYGDTVGDYQDLWLPVTMQQQVMTGRAWLEDLSSSWLHCIARLKPNTSIAQAEANVNLVLQSVLNGSFGARLNNEDRKELKESKIPVTAGGGGFSSLRADSQPLLLLMAIVGLVLLIACVNVANLLLARASARSREFAVRLAIGASSGRIVRQLLTESILLAFLGGTGGMLLAQWGTHLLLSLSGDRQLEAALDIRVLLFTAITAVLTGMLFGLIPALRSRRLAVSQILKSGPQSAVGAPGSRWSWGKSLIAGQVALSLLVLFAAGLLIRSLQNLRAVNLGYSRENLLLVRTDPLSTGYKVTQISNFGNELAARLSALPGVHAVSYSKNGLFSGSESDESITVEGFVPKSDHDGDVAADWTGPNYFSTVGIPLLLGRDIGLQDTASSRKVAVINETMSRFYFGSADPIGRKFVITDDPKKQPVEIVGVARDARDHELRGKVPRRFYMPYAQDEDLLSLIVFEIKAGGDFRAVADSVRKEIRAYDQNIAISNVRTIAVLVDDHIHNEILIAQLSGFFAAVGLLLACIGLYGLMSYTVGGKTREIGLRMALGAQRRSVLLLVLGDAMKLVAIGVIIGVPAAFAASRLLNSWLFGLKDTDPVSMLSVVMILSVVALFAGLIPARRATKVDPMVALRCE